MARHRLTSRSAFFALPFLLSAACGHTPVAKKPAAPPPWPADALFQAYPVIHCIPEALPRPFLDDIKRASKNEATASEVYTDTRDLVLTTLNLFLATGRWTGDRARITPTTESPRTGTLPECRMFELALADQITLRLPPSVSGAPYIVPIAMFGYDYEPSAAGRSPRINVRIAALLARGDGHVLRTLRAIATADYATGGASYQERSSQEVAQDLTVALAKNLAQAIQE
jgi:hypothetical protein